MQHSPTNYTPAKDSTRNVTSGSRKELRSTEARLEAITKVVNCYLRHNPPSEETEQTMSVINALRGDLMLHRNWEHRLFYLFNPKN